MNNLLEILRRDGRSAWLSVTPEPERDLPAALATLRARGAPAPQAVEHERARAQRLVLRGTERRWLAWVAEAEVLAQAGRADADPAVRRAAALVADVASNHRALRLGLPRR